MLKYICTISSAFLAFSVLAQTPESGQTHKVTGTELSKLITGATIRGDNGKFIFRHTYKKDGTLDGGSSYSGGDGSERAWDTGTWRLDGDRVCARFQKWDKQENCREIERVGDGRYRYVGARYTVTID